ncbi:MAG: Lrp/AsnC family transcriptional regulator [Nanoarchaeota archaeon]
MMNTDETDKRIIEVLQQNAKLSMQKISKKIGVPVTTVFHRVKKLEKEGIIDKYTILVNNKKLGNIITALIFVHYDISKWDRKGYKENFIKHLKSLPNVAEIKFVTGRFDLFLKIEAPDLDFLNSVILDKLRAVPGVGRTESFFVLESLR